MKIYHVWTSGYCSSDTEGGTTAPRYKGTTWAKDFEEAKKIIYRQAIDAFKGYEDKPYWRVAKNGSIEAYYGCSLHESYSDALDVCRELAHISDGVPYGGYIIKPKSQEKE